MSERPSIAFIGAGRVASLLAPIVASLGHQVNSIASRSFDSAQRVANLVENCKVRSVQEAASSAELVFITTPDDAIEAVASEISWSVDHSAVHCSGAMTLEPLKTAQLAGAAIGSWHPFQTFGGHVLLEGATFGIEADGKLLQTLEQLTEEVGGHALRIAPEARALYHAASVMSCGYLTTLISEAEGLLLEAGLSRESAMRAIGHLARSTISNIESVGSSTALTGPTSRGDRNTVRLHLETLKEHAPDLLPLYKAISLRSVELAKVAERPGGSMDWMGLFDDYVQGDS